MDSTKEQTLIKLVTATPDRMELKTIEVNETFWSNRGIPLHSLMFLQNHEIVIRLEGNCIVVSRREK